MEISRHWRTQEQRYGLVGVSCAHCDAKIFPPREICPHCHGVDLTPFTFSGRGKIYSHTTVYEAPKGFTRYVPYTVAIIELEEGPRVTAQLTDIKRTYTGDVVTGIATIMHGIIVGLGIGSPVKMVTRLLREDGNDGKGVLIYGYKFEPDVVALMQWSRERKERKKYMLGRVPTSA